MVVKELIAILANQIVPPKSVIEAFAKHMQQNLTCPCINSCIFTVVLY